MTVPQVTLAPLQRADGSATYSFNGYTVTGAVNGPIEVQRRDELPEEAAIEVNVRPATGVGSPKERHLESILHSTLRAIILTAAHPRTLIQLTLQVIQLPEDEPLLRSSSHLSILPSLLQTAILALVSANIPLKTTLSASSVAVTHQPNKTTNTSTDGKEPASTLITNPSPKQITQAGSFHVLGFSAKGDLLVCESEGRFDMDDWQRVYDSSREYQCKGEGKAEGREMRARQEDESMDDDDGNGVQSSNGKMQEFLEAAVRESVDKARRWKNAS